MKGASAEPALVLVAPDKFKGSLTADEVARTVARVLRQKAPWNEVVESPIADGGEGTVDLAFRTGYSRVQRCVPGPLGALVDAQYALSGSRAVIELAAAAGLGLISYPGDDSAVGASTYGLGLLVSDALDRGARTIVIGLGGSATTDGGAGLVAALGARLVGAHGQCLPRGGAALADAVALDLSGLDPRVRSAEIVLACDVDNPLVGPDGAATIYGPQKGAGPSSVVNLELAMVRWADVVADALGVDLRHVPGTGAAGGTAFAGLALLGGRIASGVELCMEISGLRTRLPDAKLVVIGEGSLDSQTLRGKGPAALAALARPTADGVVAVSGRCTLTPEQLRRSGIDAAYALTDIEPDSAVCIHDAERLLAVTAARVAEDWLIP